jgi:hypothetical protein
MIFRKFEYEAFSSASVALKQFYVTDSILKPITIAWHIYEL